MNGLTPERDQYAHLSGPAPFSMDSFPNEMQYVRGTEQRAESSRNPQVHHHRSPLYSHAIPLGDVSAVNEMNLAFARQSGTEDGILSRPGMSSLWCRNRSSQESGPMAGMGQTGCGGYNSGSDDRHVVGQLNNSVSSSANMMLPDYFTNRDLGLRSSRDAERSGPYSWLRRHDSAQSVVDEEVDANDFGRSGVPIGMAGTSRDIGVKAQSNTMNMSSGIHNISDMWQAQRSLANEAVMPLQGIAPGPAAAPWPSYDQTAGYKASSLVSHPGSSVFNPALQYPRTDAPTSHSSDEHADMTFHLAQAYRHAGYNHELNSVQGWRNPPEGYHLPKMHNVAPMFYPANPGIDGVLSPRTSEHRHGARATLPRPGPSPHIPSESSSSAASSRRPGSMTYASYEMHTAIATPECPMPPGLPSTSVDGRDLNLMHTMLHGEHEKTVIDDYSPDFTTQAKPYDCECYVSTSSALIFTFLTSLPPALPYDRPSTVLDQNQQYLHTDMQANTALYYPAYTRSSAFRPTVSNELVPLGLTKLDTMYSRSLSPSRAFEECLPSATSLGGSSRMSFSHIPASSSILTGNTLSPASSPSHQIPASSSLKALGFSDNTVEVSDDNPWLNLSMFSGASTHSGVLTLPEAFRWEHNSPFNLHQATFSDADFGYRRNMTPATVPMEYLSLPATCAPGQIREPFPAAMASDKVHPALDTENRNLAAFAGDDLAYRSVQAVQAEVPAANAFRAASSTGARAPIQRRHTETSISGPTFLPDHHNDILTTLDDDPFHPDSEQVVPMDHDIRHMGHEALLNPVARKVNRNPLPSQPGVKAKRKTRTSPHTGEARILADQGGKMPGTGTRKLSIACQGCRSKKLKYVWLKLPTSVPVLTIAPNTETDVPARSPCAQIASVRASTAANI